jgi:hypothetical protein
VDDSIKNNIHRKIRLIEFAISIRTVGIVFI